MTTSEKQKILDILNYWRVIEFANQKIIPIGHGLKDNIENDINKLNVFPMVNRFPLNFNYMKFIDKNKFPYIYSNFKNFGDFFYFCFGKINKNDIIKYCEKIFNNGDSKSVEKKDVEDSIAWFSLKTDKDGYYKDKSFKLSPILWIFSLCNKSNTKLDIKLNEYNEVVEKFNQKLKNENLDKNSIVEEIYNEIKEKYVNHIKKINDLAVFAEYNLYRYFNDDEEFDYADLGNSFFLKDLTQIYDSISQNKFGSTDYEKQIINYILSLDNTSQITNRTNISSLESSEKIKQFFSEVLDIRYAPLGKWASKFQPALMQQIAINLAIGKYKNVPIFSVNGPPGTGKTTLLKEIIANNLVERALFIVKQNKMPDDFFDSCSFLDGKNKNKSYYEKVPAFYKIKNEYNLINSFSMLVASSNNAAVENITKELPKSVLKDLSYSDKEIEQLEIDRDYSSKYLLDQVYKLYDVENSEEEDLYYNKKNEELSKSKDIYFSRYSEEKNSLGMISAPLGKIENIREFAPKIIRFLEEYDENNVHFGKEMKEKHLKLFEKYKMEFIKQYNKVKKIQSKIANNSFSNFDGGSAKTKFKKIDSEFILKYYSSNNDESTKAQMINPYCTTEYNREREKLLFYALKLNKEFVASSKCVKENLHNLLIMWKFHSDCKERMSEKDKNNSKTALIQSLFLFIPVISTTFHSIQLFLENVNPQSIGMLIVDEAGQAQPQFAIGGMLRSRKTMIVGDPKQIEPVVTDEVDYIKEFFFDSEFLIPYKQKNLSTQVFADTINPFGSYLGNDWIGCPLIVHRRCIEPMFSISNKISYEGTMKIQTSNPSPEKEKDFILEKSCWIDVIGQENSSDKDHYVEKQSEIVIKLIEAKLKKNKPDFKDLFVISPFTSVATGIRHVIDQKFQSNTLIQEWLEKKSIGTVHTFQGQEASEVIFLLGCDKNASPAIQWVNKNIVNVAATRAKYRFYIIGEEKIWVANNNLKIAKDCINNTIDEDELDISLGLKEISIDQLKLICPLCNKKMYPDEKKFYCSGYKSNPKCDFKIWKKSFQYGAFFSETDVKLLVNGFKTEKKECKIDDQKYLAAFKLNENGQLKKL